MPCGCGPCTLQSECRPLGTCHSMLPRARRRRAVTSPLPPPSPKQQGFILTASVASEKWLAGCANASSAKARLFIYKTETPSQETVMVRERLSQLRSPNGLGPYSRVQVSDGRPAILRVSFGAGPAVPRHGTRQSPCVELLCGGKGSGRPAARRAMGHALGPARNTASTMRVCCGMMVFASLSPLHPSRASTMIGITIAWRMGSSNCNSICSRPPRHVDPPTWTHDPPLQLAEAPFPAIFKPLI